MKIPKNANCNRYKNHKNKMQTNVTATTYAEVRIQAEYSGYISENIII